MLTTHRKLVTRLLQKYWRLTRSHVLGARVLVYDANGLLLLLREGPDQPWRLPGGQVLANESAIDPLIRALPPLASELARAQLTAVLTADPVEYGCDQMALFTISLDKPNDAAGAPSLGYFNPAAPPRPIEPATLARLREATTGTSGAMW